jgi:WD40 repeat protein
MSYPKLLCLAVTLSCAAIVAAAGQDSKESSTAISAENAQQVRLVREVPLRADKVVRGPQRGELTLLDWPSAIEVVDDVNLGTLRTIVKDHHPVDFAMSPDGKLVAWSEGEGGVYTVQETAGGKTFEIKVGARGGYAAFSPDGSLLAIGHNLATASDLDEGYCEMKIWDTTGRLVRTLEGSKQGGLTPMFSPDGKTLAVGNRNYETRLFEVATGKLLHTLNKHMTHEIAFSPDGKTLAAAYVDGTVALWDVATGTLEHSVPSGCKEVYSVDWSPKGDVLATSGRQGKIVLWEPRKMSKLKELDAPAWVIRVRFTADGKRLLSSSSSNDTSRRERKITVWAVPGGVAP